jgi:[glutamine synthetase] adenylyltransferase / [glutamine synthetase]-adenylyl-L-tyrosine phosphorylase
MSSSPADQSTATTLAAQIRSAPHLSAAQQARTRVREWLAANAKTAAGDRLNQLVATHPPLRALIEGIADGSPHLWELASSEPERLVAMLQADPQQHLAALRAKTFAAVATRPDEAEARRLLRRMKTEAALLIALVDIGGVWPVMRITQAMTEVADTAVGAAVRFLLGDAARRARLKPRDAARPEEGSGYIVLAMGKMGAFELNYSSDIDLIVFFDPAVPAVGDDPSALFVRLTQRLIRLLQERTKDGYVFRVDLRLRPDPASTAVAVSTPAALTYYESRGQNWERAALIKARPCAGDFAAGDALLAELAPFVWRKYLDFVALGDVHAMKRQIHVYKGHGEIAVEGHNIKLGRGGIREIEFFVQTQQLIAGGRHPALRDRTTLTTLAALADGGWIGGEARTDLDAAYRFLRSVEHRLQMVADEQTHTLPPDRDGLERFARFAGFADRDAFAALLVGHLRNVQRHYASLFEHAFPSNERRALAFPPEADDRETLDRLVEMGFRQPLEVSAAVRRWLAGGYRSLKGGAARDQFAELVTLLLDQLARSENPEAAVLAFDRFLSGLHGGGRLFSLLRQNPDLVALIALVLGTAPRLADSLARYPQVMDGLIDPSFFGVLPDEQRLSEGLARSLQQADSDEDFLDRIRMFGQEQMFLIGTRILSGTVSAEQAGEVFARLADVLLRALHASIEKTFAAQHGRLPGQQFAVLALGKLGGREMTATSDLDLIVVYDYAGEDSRSDGVRPLYGSQYFSRLTQRLISALTTQTNYGVLYQVDMRLRPSGRSGPLATRIDAFETYQENEAWTWEHMALTRARVVSASAGFGERVERAIRAVLTRPRDPAAIAGDVVEMRRALAAEKGESERWDLKYAAGGLVDVEFIAHYLQLIHAAQHPEILDTNTARVLEKTWRLGLLTTEDAEVLRAAVRLYHDLTQILRLCLAGPFDAKKAGTGLLRLLARAADVPDFATLEAHLAATQAQIRDSFSRILAL